MTTNENMVTGIMGERAVWCRLCSVIQGVEVRHVTPCDGTPAKVFKMMLDEATDLQKQLEEAKKRIATLETVHKQDDEIIKALEFNIEHVEKRLAGLAEAARQSKKLIEAFVERWPVDFLNIPGASEVYNVLDAAVAGGKGST